MFNRIRYLFNWQNEFFCLLLQTKTSARGGLVLKHYLFPCVNKEESFLLYRFKNNVNMGNLQYMETNKNPKMSQ